MSTSGERASILTPLVATTSPNRCNGDLAVGKRFLALSNPNSHAEIGDTQTFSPEVPAALMASTASGLIASSSAIQMIAQVSSSSLLVTVADRAQKPAACSRIRGEVSPSLSICRKADD